MQPDPLARDRAAVTGNHLVAPSDLQFASALRASRGHIVHPVLRRVEDSIMHRRGGRLPHRPRGPRSGPGYSVPVRHHLIGPIRPTHGHIPISPHGGLYAMPSLCGERLSDSRVVPSFHCSFLPGMPSSPTPGSPTSIFSRASMPTLAFAD